MRVSHKCLENFHVSLTIHELVAKVLNMFKNFMRIFSPKYFARLSCDGRAMFVPVSRTCRINVYSMRLQRESCVYITNLWREIVENYSRTTLQLSHSSEIGALGVIFNSYLIFR